MNRNDILRELELLPAWQLKIGFQISHEALVKTPSATLVVEQKVSKENSTPEPVTTKPVTTISKQAVAILVFLNTPKTDDFYVSEAGILLDNMLKAIELKRGENLVVAFAPDELQAYAAQLVLALGEQAAQQLANTSESLPVLRGRVHEVNATQVIASHDLAHLLSQPLLKRDAWQDLKLLKLTLINLQSSKIAP